MIKYLAEFVGTFILLFVIFRSSAKSAPFPAMAPLLVACAATVAGVVFAEASGGHLNPAVSIAMFMNKSLEMSDLAPYIAAQIMGAVAAWATCEQLKR